MSKTSKFKHLVMAAVDHFQRGVPVKAQQLHEERPGTTRNEANQAIRYARHAIHSDTAVAIKAGDTSNIKPYIPHANPATDGQWIATGATTIQVMVGELQQARMISTMTEHIRRDIGILEYEGHITPGSERAAILESAASRAHEAVDQLTMAFANAFDEAMAAAE
jgi:hypothetical protein